jgi:hypothetical protein
VTQADYAFMASPLATDRLMLKRVVNMLWKMDQAKWDALEAAGFVLDPDIDVIRVLYEQLGGHYIDIGASKMIGDGKVGPLGCMLARQCALIPYRSR